jgi:hypothetical protein
VDYPEYLRDRQHEVEDLRKEEQKHSLCEVAQNADHGESHTRKVAESVSNEYA